MRTRADTIPMFEIDPDQFELTAIIEAHKELRHLADKWMRAHLERIEALNVDRLNRTVALAKWSARGIR